MKVKGITVLFSDDAGNPFTCTQDQDFRWIIPVPVYPRILGFLNQISAARREFDKKVERPDTSHE